MAKVLVTGGCGYIGSHTIVDLLDSGHEVVSIDSHIRSSANILKGISEITAIDVKNEAIDLCDEEKVKAFFQTNKDIDAIIHFAALKSVPESVSEPIKYYQNNINSLLNVLKYAPLAGIENIIFSSSCSVYGNTTQLPVTENTPLLEAQSPYARTKQICEQILQDAVKSNPSLKVVLLRYFNPAGAHPSIKIGEYPQAGAYNMVPILTETAAGLRPIFTIHGGDYATRDGSCIRDYIHVCDLAKAHTLCVDYLQNQKVGLCEAINIGIGQGVTVLEAVKTLETVLNKPLNYTIGERRNGDVVAIYANYEKAKQLLGWQPQYDIKDIMKTAWLWQQVLLNAKSLA